MDFIVLWRCHVTGGVLVLVNSKGWWQRGGDREVHSAAIGPTGQYRGLAEATDIEVQ
jgi:hypothetical protein